MRFEFATATRIIFGEGAARELAPIAATLGTRALLVVGQRVEGAATLIAELNARANDGIAWVRAVSAQLNIAPLSQLGLAPADFPAVIAQAQEASSTKGNPIALTDEELRQALERAL